MSSLALYDKALYNKIHELFPNVVNSSEDSALSDSLDSDRGNSKEKLPDDKEIEVMLPLISFWRTDNPPAMSGFNEGNYAEILRGRRNDVSQSNGFNLRTFPVSISYQITIWSDKRIEVDEIYQEFLMLFFVDEPYIKVTAVKADFMNEDTDDKDKVVVEEEFSLQLEDSSSNIDVSSFSDRGRIYRQDIIVSIDNAKLFYLGNNMKVAKTIPVKLLEMKMEVQ